MALTSYEATLPNAGGVLYVPESGAGRGLLPRRHDPNQEDVTRAARALILSPRADRREMLQDLTPEYLALLALQQALIKVKSLQPVERGEKAKYWDVAIMDLEKVAAFFDRLVVENDGLSQ